MRTYRTRPAKEKTHNHKHQTRIEAHEDMARPSLHQWIDALHEAAEAHLEKMPGEKRRDYISKQTWEKIEQLNELSKGQQAPEAFQES